MYQISGTDFSDLIKREFTQGFTVAEAEGSIKDAFICKTKCLREENFDILHFGASFQNSVLVKSLVDTSHVSLHFQISGNSDAAISGFEHSLPMYQGSYNLLNCVDPISSFSFPKQKKYEYVCVGLKQSFFEKLLLECGTAYEKVLAQSQKGSSFSLFDRSKTTTHLQIQTLKHIQSPPVAEALQPAYIRSKVKELFLLTIGDYEEKQVSARAIINAQDADRLYCAREYLSQNYLLPLTMEEISKKFLLNDFKLKGGFKKLFGVTVFKYIQQLRMGHAVTLIQNGGYTIGEIAEAIGYNSDAAFIRSFKKHKGYTPGKRNVC